MKFPISRICGSSGLLLLLVAGASSGCAGPTTPLGAIWGLTAEDVQPSGQTPEQSQSEVSESENEPPPVFKIHGNHSRPLEASSIRFSPPHQVLHAKRDIRVIVSDVSGTADLSRVRFRYNGMDITRSVLNQARVRRSPEGRRLAVTIPSVRLSSVIDHEIEVTYRVATGTGLQARYGRPVCRAFQDQPLKGTDHFEPGEKLLATIVRVARESGMNPSFAAGLIAQESGFDPRQVSFARAIGLTQITPIAETEISEMQRRQSEWPRYPGINSVSAPMLKTMVYSGLVNSENEWRLSPEKSVRGGLLFLQALARQWSNSAPGARMPAVGGDHELVRTELLLASYHSGYSRVQSAMSRLGSHWIEAPELAEARKYVNQVLSYCDYFSVEPGEFSNEGMGNENAT